MGSVLMRDHLRLISWVFSVAWLNIMEIVIFVTFMCYQDGVPCGDDSMLGTLHKRIHRVFFSVGCHLDVSSLELV